MKNISIVSVILCVSMFTVAARADEPRFRWGVEAGAQNTFITAHPLPMSWGGHVGAQLGVQFSDSFGAAFRPRILMSGGDVAMLTFSNIVSLDVALDDRFELGVGAGFDYWMGNWQVTFLYNGGSMFAAEAHASYRIAGDRRHGLLVSVTPHVAIFGRDAFVTTMVSLGYASF